MNKPKQDKKLNALKVNNLRCILAIIVCILICVPDTCHPQ